MAAIIALGLLITTLGTFFPSLLLPSGKRSDTGSRWVDLTSPSGRAGGASGESVEGRRRLRIALAPVISPERSLARYQLLVSYLAGQLGRRGELLQRQSYAEVNELLRSQRCDVAFICTYAFVRGERDFGLRLLAAPQVHGARTYRSYIIVPAASTAASLLDLRSTRFASADLLSNTGWLYPATWLREHGENADAFFQEHLITKSHDRAIEAVGSGIADGAAVDSLVFTELEKAGEGAIQRVRIIQRSKPFGMPPLVCPRQLDEELFHGLRRVLLAMHEDRTGKAILMKLEIDRFFTPAPEEYDSVRRAVRAMEGGR